MRTVAAALAALVLAGTAPAHGGAKNLWTHKKLMNTAQSAVVRIDGKGYIVLPESCKGEGKGVLRGGKRAWRHFRCTGLAVRESFSGGIRFRIHVIRDGTTFVTSNGQLLK